MATIRFTDLLEVGTDMSHNDFFYGSPVTSNATTLRFSDGDYVITYTGAFTKRHGDVSGRLDGVTESLDGKVVYTATGLDKDAAVVWALAEADDDAGALRYLLSGADLVVGTSFADLLAGGGGRDVLQGGSGADRLDGGTGGDRLHGDSGKDRLVGGSGADRLYGGTGEDRLAGGGDDDVLRGGERRDRLSGGDGADDFVFATRFEVAMGDLRDAILDFSRAEDDRIDLEGLDADTLQAGSQAFDYIGRSGFSEAAGELRFANGLVAGDVNGDGSADFQIEVAEVARLSASDFIL